MRNIFKVIGITAFVAVFAFSTVSCSKIKSAIGGGGSGGSMTWTEVEDKPFNGVLNAVAFGNGKFVAVSEKGKIAYSVDGITWIAVEDTMFSDIGIYCIAYGNGKFVADFYENSIDKMAYSADGITWTIVEDSTFNALQADYIVYGGNKFIAIGMKGKIAYLLDE